MTEQSPPKSSLNQGRIITFYSYKGGTGRSMAVANVAWILASQGQRVLVIDWDLEAPGLHRYFHPFIEDKELSASPGVIDFLVDFVEGSRLSHRDQGKSENACWFEGYTNLLPYAFSLDWEFANNGTLDFVPAGQQGPGYGVRVMTFDWQGFYDNLGGGVFLEAVKQRLRAEYEYILIDSRTGISDTSGICTVQMPDDLVVCFTLNNQSIRGATAVAESAFGQRRKPTGEPGLRVWPVPTRVELGEQDKLKLARAYSRSKFDGFLDHLRRTSKEEYWGRVETLYFPWYAYEEVLAAFGDMPKESNSLLAATERLTAYLTDGKIMELAPPSEEERVKVRDQFTRGQQIALPLYDVFISYSPHDREWVRSELLPQLEAAGLKVSIDYRDFEIGISTLINIERAYDSSRHVLIVLTRSWLESVWPEFESLLINTNDPTGRQRKILPLLLEPCDLPPRLQILTYADLTNSAEHAREMERLIRSIAPHSPSVPSQAIATMALDKHEDRMLLARLFEKLPEVSNTFNRSSLIEELDLDPNEFQVDEGNAHTFAVSFVALLYRQGRQETLQNMVTMLLRRPDAYKNELGQLREALGMPATHQGEAGSREVGEDIENKLKVQAAAMAEFKGVLRRVREQIDRVSKYKELHEQLHNLQFLYNVIDDAVRTLPGNETAQDSLREYNIRFEGIVAELQEIARHAVFISAENVWVQKLCQVQKEFHDAVEHINVTQMKRGIRSIAQELAIRPVLINKSLTTAAQQLSITSLTDAMNILEQRYNLINISSNQIRQFKNKVNDLEELFIDLISLINEHGTWQEVDIVLRRIGGNTQEILDEMDLSWPDLKQKTIMLYLDGRDDWAQRFKEDSEKLEHSIAARDPKNVRSSFRNYRNRAEVRFFTVDKKLRDQCVSMSMLVTQLLEMME